MMSNSNSTTFGNGLQQHNLTAAIDYLNQNGPSPLATYPNVSRTENTLMLDKQTTATFFTPSTNPSSYYSTQLVTQTPSTILITNNFGGPDESSTTSGVNNNFNNSSIRIVTHNNNNNNNNTHHTNINNNNNNAKLDEVTSDKQQHYHHLHHLHHQALPLAPQHSSSISPPNSVTMPNSLVNASTVVSAPAAPVPGLTNTSTVVLDRINICINNHYGDASTIPPSVVTPQSGTLCSPIIPPLTMTQHTTTVDGIVSLPSTCVDGTVATGKLKDASNLEMHVDEPDSTTTTHCHSNSIPMELDDQDEHLDLDKTIEFDMFTMQKFVIGEDALVKRRDGRYYLGTVVDIHRQQYLVQFDDKTDYWSNVDELMKLSSEIISKNMPTCLSCKQENENDVVEICERCGRGYHRQCTREVTSKSGEWMCKRCVKPMKFSLEDESNEKPKQKKCKYSIKQLPYELDTLTWDEKHRVNLEQTYCYCGKSGQFDNNMIQCCKCKQWFHAHCVECVKTLFRGDVFFIFGCSVCNDGKEFLRRIEIDWADLVHLILYNMSLSKNFQKYHHLHKNIYPFAIEKRDSLQLPKSMLKLSDSEFKASILKTLLSHPKLFQCGKEIKKDHSAWGLRSNKPPQGPIYDIKRDEVLCNKLISEKLKINILPHNEEDEQTDEYQEESPREFIKDGTILPAIKTKINLLREDDDKFTSDDEIPIKLILDKVKRSNSTLNLRETTKDDIVNSNQLYNHRSIDKEIKEKQQDSIEMVKLPQKSSRKRKAFTLSKGYKDSDKSNDLPRSICDSSSDENSSSSRGTLDLIIPPPKDFLGLNNPFRMVTPKKCDDPTAKSTGITRKTVSFGSNALDLNSKIAALKGSGIFPNISNSDIAKAAGQPRLVRTIKRRLSAKDIVIGPNQEVRRRRTRALSTNVEIISTTTINSIPCNFFPIRATVPESSNSTNSSKPTTSSSQSNSPHITSSALSSLDGLPLSNTVTTHGRRLRKRPEKSSPQNSRRNSISSSSSSISSSGPASNQQQFALPPPSQTQNAVPISDLKKSVNKYFGAANRIENGEKFTIRAKRRLTNGQMQYLFEWES